MTRDEIEEINKKKYWEEEWLPIMNYEGCYSISSYGRVRREKRGYGTYIGKILAICPDKQGYVVYVLSNNDIKKTFKAHFLVAIHFIGPPSKILEINHKDGTKINNHYSNLEYITPKENMQHAHRNGLVRYSLGDNNGSSKISESIVIKIRNEYIPRINSQSMLGRKYKISQTQVGRIINYKRWKNVR